MAHVERDDLVEPEAFCDCDDASIDTAERQVGVLLDEVGRTCQVFGEEIGNGKEASGKRPEEHGLDMRSGVTGE